MKPTNVRRREAGELRHGAEYIDGSTSHALRALAAALLPHLRPLLAVHADDGTYSSTNLPPGCNGRTFARWCRSGRVDGAEPDGRGWRCSVEAWRRARAAGKRRPVVLALVPDSDEAEAAHVASLVRSKR